MICFHLDVQGSVTFLLLEKKNKSLSNKIFKETLGGTYSILKVGTKELSSINDFCTVLNQNNTWYLKKKIDFVIIIINVVYVYIHMWKHSQVIQI